MNDSEQGSARTRLLWACGASTTVFVGIATAGLTGKLGQVGWAEGAVFAGCVALAMGRLAWEIVEMLQWDRPRH